MLGGNDLKHIEEVREHNADCLCVDRTLSGFSALAKQVKGDRDAARHPAIRSHLEEVYDGLLAESNQLRSDLRSPLIAAERVLRAKYQS